MKSKLTILFTLIWFSVFSQVSVPNTTTFSLQDVKASIESHSEYIPYSLRSCFEYSVDKFFNSSYAGYKDNQLNFRDYNPSRFGIILNYVDAGMNYFEIGAEVFHSSYTGAARGIVWGTTPDPVVNISNADASDASYTPGSTLNGIYTMYVTSTTGDPIYPNYTYYVRAFVKDNTNQYYYSNNIIVNTPVSDIIVKITNVNYVTSRGFSIACDMENYSGKTITGRGVVYSQNEDPTLANGYNIPAGSGAGVYNATGSNSTSTPILPSTMYYVRPYVTVSGQGTVYGSGIRVTTDKQEPGNYIPVIGETFEGGVVYDIEDLPDKTVVYITSPRLGTKAREWRTAQKQCWDYRGGGYSDWTLPMIATAYKLRAYLQTFVYPNYPSDVPNPGRYWCSEHYYYNFIPPQTYAATVEFNDQSTYTYKAVQQDWWYFAIRKKYILK